MAKTGNVEKEIAQNVSIGVDKNNAMVLQLNMDEGLLLNWDAANFRELPEEVVLKLRPDNLRRYTVVETQVRSQAKAAMGKIEITNPFNPLLSREEAVLQIRKRNGWHQCWKAPGRDFETAMSGPYKQVRKPGTDPKTGKDLVEEPGYESGEVKKLIDAEGKMELIACECPQELFDQYLEWMSAESRQKFTDVKTNFFQKTEEINRGAHRGARITPFDDSKELQA